MTDKAAVIHTNRRIWVLLTALCVIAVGMSSPLADGVRQGLRLCAGAVIPAVFPSMILADVLLSFRDTIERSPLAKAFTRVFHMPPAASVAYLLGLCTGFPIGMRVCAQLYRENSLTREQAERLMCFCNNTGPAFLIAGIGEGLYGDARIGFALWLCQLLASLSVGILLGIRRRSLDKQRETFDEHRVPPRPFSLVESVRGASASCVTLCGFVGLFSALSYLLVDLIPSRGICMVLLPFLEIGTAASYLGTCGLSGCLPLSATAFAVGFSGISVHMQSMVFFQNLHINSRQYYVYKIATCVVCALLICLPYLLYI